ncbi:MAG TPA: type I restriction endonuclease subunit R [Candidatus Spyradenecus faecavium]|uniref:Type I restriction endonuclease subunit R n=1 Tax=Candidatus Spyradenecus faecavium TaxID=2840947 RepID=A0A9D1NMP6_9BACT|nr:type I restriction endonuclease subunit R [Candidatus Spyradenecus faecavium]
MIGTDVSEKGLETTFVSWLVGQNGYEEGTNADYDRGLALDTTRLLRFLESTQGAALARLGADKPGREQRQLLERVSREVAKRGVVDVLRNGVKERAEALTLFWQTPSAGNAQAAALHAQNLFSVTRQLRYSEVDEGLALDLCLFINGLPVATLELKNRLTKQCAEDAVRQYRHDRDPRERLFAFKRCLVHVAVDDRNVRFCTRLAGEASVFLPFDKGNGRGGAGNPVNPEGLGTDYLWKDILTKETLGLIVERYAQVTGSGKQERLIFPRYHQLDAVRRLLADVRVHGVGRRYLIQHSAGSGKSNSIAWLAHQLIELQGADGRPLLNSVFVVTDRRNLDRQLRGTIRQFLQEQSTLGWAEHSGDLRRFIEEGKRLIVTTVEKFPHVVGTLNSVAKDKRFAVIIDEAHSSQSGQYAATMNQTLAGGICKGEDAEDMIDRLMAKRRFAGNTSYFAFTATPKNKTLEAFGEAYAEDGVRRFRPFHVYTMRQAIEEGFILDVLAHYTTVESYYRLRKTVADDPEFDGSHAQKLLRSFVEGNKHAIAIKAGIMVDHFLEKTVRKIGGEARAMVVTMNITRCVETWRAIKRCLEERGSPHQALIAFTGEYHDKETGEKVTSAGLNGFPDTQIPARFKESPYRILVVADMFQTGFDEPLLHTMYVDKRLSDVKAVQTLSRLNRCHPKKKDTCVMDFANDAGDIQQAFERYYKTTLLVGETNPNKLNDLADALERTQVYEMEDVRRFVRRFLEEAPREELDPMLDACVERYRALTEDEQVKFKGGAKTFVRLYDFLGAILPYLNKDWEVLAIFLRLLIGKLPSPKGEDLTEGLLQAVDLESYRTAVLEERALELADKDAEIDPIPVGGGGHVHEPELDPLSAIIASFNEHFGNIQWKDQDYVIGQIKHLPERVAKDTAYQNAIRNNDRQNALVESKRALSDVITQMVGDNMELYKQFFENPDFQRWLAEMVFTLTYRSPVQAS